MKLGKVLFMSIVALCSVACNKGANLPAVEDIAGNYDGYVLASCAYFKNTCSAGEKVVVSKNTDGTAMIACTSATWGELTISSAQMTANDGVYSLTGNGSIKMEKGGNVSSYDCTFTAQISSKDNAQMQFVVADVMGGLTLDFKTGEAPADLLLAGTYKGYSDADCTYFKDKYTDNESLKITANGDGTIAIKFESAAWGTFEVAKATITKSGDEYSFTGEGSVVMEKGDSKNNYDFTVNGTTNAAKDKFSIAFEVPAVMGGLTVTLLPGSAPSTQE